MRGQAAQTRDRYRAVEKGLGRSVFNGVLREYWLDDAPAVTRRYVLIFPNGVERRMNLREVEGWLN